MSGSLSSVQARNTNGASQADDGEAYATALVVKDVAQELIAGGVKPDKANIVAERIILTVTEKIHSGPLPDVDDFAGYERVCPGAAREILDMAVRQQQHGIWMQRAELILEFVLKLVAFGTAVVVFAMMLYAAVEAASKGHKEVAIAIASGAGIVAVGGIILRNFFRSEPAAPQPPAPPQPPSGQRRRKR